MGLYLFGSTARDQARETSDVDLFFDYDNPKFSQENSKLNPPIEPRSATLHPSRAW